jgi:hypothetical protein
MCQNDAVRAIVARTRAEQGLPPTIEDPATLKRVATILELPAAAEVQQNGAPSSRPHCQPRSARGGGAFLRLARLIVEL